MYSYSDHEPIEAVFEISVDKNSFDRDIKLDQSKKRKKYFNIY